MQIEARALVALDGMRRKIEVASKAQLEALHSEDSLRLMLQGELEKMKGSD